MLFKTSLTGVSVICVELGHAPKVLLHYGCRIDPFITRGAVYARRDSLQRLVHEPKLRPARKVGRERAKALGDDSEHGGVLEGSRGVSSPAVAHGRSGLCAEHWAGSRINLSDACDAHTCVPGPGCHHSRFRSEVPVLGLLSSIQTSEAAAGTVTNRGRCHCVDKRNRSTDHEISSNRVGGSHFNGDRRSPSPGVENPPDPAAGNPGSPTQIPTAPQV